MYLTCSHLWLRGYGQMKVALIFDFIWDSHIKWPLRTRSSYLKNYCVGTNFNIFRLFTNPRSIFQVMFFRLHTLLHFYFFFYPTFYFTLVYSFRHCYKLHLVNFDCFFWQFEHLLDWSTQLFHSSSLVWGGVLEYVIILYCIVHWFMWWGVLPSVEGFLS